MSILFLILNKYKHTLFISRAQSKNMGKLCAIHKANMVWRPAGIFKIKVSEWNLSEAGLLHTWKR